jgi:DNA-binding transcriptional regulator/RsmH inhibitor MraZ
MFPARVDEKGRLKLPGVFLEYFGAFPEKKLFVTSLNGRTGQLYNSQVWRETKKELGTRGTSGKDTLWLANDYGEDQEIDGQGRVQLPTNLRRELGLENQQVRLVSEGRRIEILSDAMYQQRKHQALKSAEQNMAVFDDAGIL